MKILITGDTGLVGSNLKKKLVNHDVVGLSRSTGCDLNNIEKVEREISNAKPDVVYHCAANSAESRGHISPIDMTQNNLGIFVNVLKASINARVKKFIYISSVAVYGEAPIPYKEDAQLRPKDVYGVNKMAAELILRIMAKVYNFEYVIIRPHNIYGPGQDMSNPHKNVVALFMRNIIENKPYTLYGGGNMRRAFSFVDDVVGVLEECLTDRIKNTTINVGSDLDISVRELSDLIQKIARKKAKVTLLPARPQEISMFLADHTLQHSLFNYHQTPIMEGLTLTWEWVKKKQLPMLKVQNNEINV